MEQEFRAVSCRIRDELDRHAMARFLGRKVMIDPCIGIYERLDGSVLEIDFTRPLISVHETLCGHLTDRTNSQVSSAYNAPVRFFSVRLGLNH
jgi:hypothetical protein